MNGITWQTPPNTPAQQNATMPAAAKGCGCDAMIKRAKIMQIMIMVAYALLIIYLFKAITK